MSPFITRTAVAMTTAGLLYAPCVGEVVVSNRPFGMDAGTMHAHLDGFFDTSIGDQFIGVYLTNNGTETIIGASATASFPVGSNISMTQGVAQFGDLKPGVPTLAIFRGNFSGSTPDKHPLNLSITGNSGSFNQNASRNVFVTYDVHDPNDVNTWTMFAPEGAITTTIGAPYGGHHFNSLTAPTGWDWTLEHAAPFSGQFSELPYGDPWWKAFGLGFGIGGSINWVVGAIVKRCGNEKDGKLIINVGQAEKGAGALAAAADSADPFRRGQENTMPLPTEQTIRELVTLNAIHTDEPTLGTNWHGTVSWTYTRVTTGNSYNYSVTDEPIENIHYTTSRDLTINDSIFAPGEELRLTASANGPSGSPVAGDRAFFIANILPTSDASYDDVLMSILMRDDGNFGDQFAGDGIYTGSANTLGLPTNVQLGAYVFGFDVNNALLTDPPTTAAQEIGGTMISSPVCIDCDITPDFTFTVTPEPTMGWVLLAGFGLTIRRRNAVG